MKPYSFYLNKLYEVGPIEWGKLALTRWHISRRRADTSWKLIVPEFLKGNILQQSTEGSLVQKNASYEPNPVFTGQACTEKQKIS